MQSFMDDYQLMQQMQQGGQQDAPMQQAQGQQMPQQAPRQASPLGAGASRAIEEAKRSLRMNQEEKEHAFNQSMMQFFMALGEANNSPQTQQGFAGNLGRISAAMNPAIKTYEEEREKIAKQNWEIQKYQKELETQAKKEAMERERLNHQMEMQHKNLEINQAYLNLESQKRQEEDKEFGLLEKGGAIHLDRIKTQGMQQYVMRDYQKQMERGTALSHMKDTVTRLQHIYARNPGIGSDTDRLFVAAQQAGDDPTMWRQILIDMKVPEEKRADYERAGKYLNSLTIDGVKALGAAGGRPNIFVEKIMRASLPGAHMSATANQKIFKEIYQDLDHQHEAIVKFDEDFQDGIYKPLRGLKPTEKPYEEGQEGQPPQQGSGIASHYSTDQLLKMRAEKLKQGAR